MSEVELVRKLRVGPVGQLTCDDAAAAIERLLKERDEALVNVARLEDEAPVTWPQWAAEILKRLEDAGYHYDAGEEIDLPADFADHVEQWIQGIERKYKDRAEAAEAQVAALTKALTEIWNNVSDHMDHTCNCPDCKVTLPSAEETARKALEASR